MKTVLVCGALSHAEIRAAIAQLSSPNICEVLPPEPTEKMVLMLTDTSITGATSSDATVAAIYDRPLQHQPFYRALPRYKRR